ncbi:MAG: DeoR family transcriptional regulator [Akkermansia sp.]|nr:DeoR family transcriptional regulator [Akkermansia sp.]
MYVAHERRAYILRLLQQRGTLRSAELAEELNVTDETIRTDLVALQAQGLLERVRGGARYILPRHGSEDAARLHCQLAALARPHLKPGARVYLDHAETALAVIAALAGDTAYTHRPLTLVCPAPELLHRLSAAALPHHLECPGGQLDKESGLLEDAAALATLRVDIALLSPPALRPDAARYPHPLRARWAAAASAAAKRTLLILPAAALEAEAASNAPYAAPLFRPLLLTEDALPPEFDDMPAETVPAITLEDILPERLY